MVACPTTTEIVLGQFTQYQQVQKAFYKFIPGLWLQPLIGSVALNLDHVAWHLSTGRQWTIAAEATADSCGWLLLAHTVNEQLDY